LNPVRIVSAGLVTSVGLSAESACAAIRVGIANPTTTRFIAADGEWIKAHQVPLEEPVRGRPRLVKMLIRAIVDCLGEPPSDVDAVPLLLCLAERTRPGRLEGIDELLFEELERDLSVRFHPAFSGVIARGRVGVPLALARARELVNNHGCPRVIVAAADSLVVGPTLVAYHSKGRLLSKKNSNGFLPGEAAGALLVSADEAGTGLVCEGIGVAAEAATVEGDAPLRADGLTAAISLALQDASCDMSGVDYRITDNSGEHYYFKEAALAMTRTTRVRKEEFEVWHPADCIGEVGAAIGIAAVAVGLLSGRKGYSPGQRCLVHLAADGGARSALVLRYDGNMS
jgi:3-oxoacyl-[acyl-carrier-protein] synthase-1